MLQRRGEKSVLSHLLPFAAVRACLPAWFAGGKVASCGGGEWKRWRTGERDEAGRALEAVGTSGADAEAAAVLRLRRTT